MSKAQTTEPNTLYMAFAAFTDYASSDEIS